MNVRVDTIPPIRIAGYEHRGPYDAIGDTWARLNRDLAEHRELLGPATMMVSVYYDDPAATPDERLRSLAGFSIDDTHRPPAGLRVDVLQASRYAITMYRGPYAGLADAWGQLSDWAREHGHEAAPLPCFEVYRSMPREGEDGEPETELFLPVTSREP